MLFLLQIKFILAKIWSIREKWRGSKYDFYLIAHEHLYVFRKPEKDESVTKFRESMKH